MKVLIIHNFYQYWGGEDTYVTSLQKILTKNSHKVILYSKNSKNITNIWKMINTALSLFWNPKVALELNSIIQKEKPDVAHFNNVFPLIGPTAYWICKKNNLKIIQTIHNYRFMCPNGILFRKGKICELCIHKKFPLWAILNGCYHRSYFSSFFFSLSFFLHKSILKTFESIDTFIFPSQFTMSYYKKNLGFKMKRPVFLPYFIDSKFQKKQKKREDYFLFVGRLSEEKGIIDLLDTFKNTPDKKIKVIGTGPLQKQIEKYKQYKNIEILGFTDRKKIFKILQKSKGLYVPSKWYEVSPFVILEAMITNTPVFTKKHLKSNLKTEQLTVEHHLTGLFEHYR